MSNREEPHPTREDRVGEAVAWYYQAAEAGTPPEPATFLARFPDLRPELESFLADKGAFDRAVGPPASPRLDPDATLPPSANNDTATLPPSDPSATVARAGADASLGSVRYFGDYELLSEIARGGMGVVFRARQVSLNREVALKMILTGQLASASDVTRFRAEAEAAANLDHPNVLPIYEVGEHQGQQYFAMKLVPEGSLAGKVAGWVNDPKTAVAVFVKVCRAVDFAHRRGILHRDLKPGNVLLDNDGTPFVTDFGLAKKVDGDSNLTQSGAIVGTPSYMAPEQARAEKQLTTAADVYALGAILYELLTGRPPFRGPTVLDTILQVLEQEAPDPRTLNPKVDRDLTVIALKCLEKTPTKRYESAAALADDLERWNRGEPILARPVTQVERTTKWVKRNPALSSAVAAGLLIAAVSFVVVLLLWLRADVERDQAVRSQQAEAEQRTIAEAARTAEAQRVSERDEALKKEAERVKERDIAITKQYEAIKVADARARDFKYQLGISNMLLANTAYDNRDMNMATERLDNVPTEQRGWEWHFLKRQTLGGLFTLYGHTGPVTAASVSSDGTRIVTASQDRTAKVWDARTGRLLLDLRGHKDTVTAASFSADGSRIVTSSQDTLARIWDARTGRFCAN